MYTLVQNEIKDDGLILPTTRNWSRDKHRFVSGYAEVFSKAMKNRWENRVYIDLFSAAGLAKVKETDEIVRTSSLLALDVSNPFDTYIFCDEKEEHIKALKKRVEMNFPDLYNRTNYLTGDANQIVDSIKESIPRYSKSYKVLSFCFIDPYNVDSLKFETVRSLSEYLMDFLVLIPSHMEVQRWLKQYLPLNNLQVEEFTGDKDWREKWDNAQRSQKFETFFTDVFGNSMKSLGYIYKGVQSTQLIRFKMNRPLYRLAFFSRQDRGANLWKEVQKFCDPRLRLF